MSQENVELVRRNNDAWNRGDYDSVLATMAVGVEWVIAEENPNAHTLRGHEEIRRYWEDWRSTLAEVTYELDEVIDAGDAVVTLGHVSGRPGAAGPAVRVPLAMIYVTRDGIAVRVEEFLDPKKALEAVGLSE